MQNSQISSLQSPHVERVKALLGPRGKKFRQSEKAFIADGLQSVREALSPKIESAPKVEKLYVSEAGWQKIQEEIAPEVLANTDIFPVTDQVMAEMADTDSPQGIIALCSYTQMTMYKIAQKKPIRLAYFWEIQDPGNCGTVIRTADACGFDAVIFSEKSVDAYSPKTVRATVGSLWHIPVVENIGLEEIINFAKEHEFATIAFAGESEVSILDAQIPEKSILIFGNEARGLPEIADLDQRLKIPMKGFSESLNVASAAAIAMFHVGLK